MPTTSPDILIADEIVTAINAPAFSQAFVAERLYAPDWDEKDELGSLQVGVWPNDETVEIWERPNLLKTYEINLGFAKRVEAVSRDTLDGLMDLVNEVAVFLDLQTVELGDGRQYYFIGREYLIRFATSFLDRNKGADDSVKYTGKFASAFTITYQEAV